MRVNRWWDRDPDEIFWLEITDRADIGADLNAPQRSDAGNESYGYSLVLEVSQGNIAFHYDKNQHAIIACSFVVTTPYEDEVVWGAHGTVARGHGVRPYPRPGWRVGIDNSVDVTPPVTLSQIRDAERDLVRINRNIQQSGRRRPTYFPLAFSDRRPVRPVQAYMTKLPRAVVDLFPALAEARVRLAEAAAETERPAPPSPDAPLGSPYRPANTEASVSSRDPFSVDPSVVERGLLGHAETQESLAAFVRTLGAVPRSPSPGEPRFDILWELEGKVFVAEIKSLTIHNEEKQLRLGLGQVLRYRDLLGRSGREVFAVLVGERQPSDSSWRNLCEDLGIILTSPQRFSIDLSSFGQFGID